MYAKIFLKSFFTLLLILLFSACSNPSGENTNTTTATDGASSMLVSSVSLGADSLTDTYITDTCSDAGGIAIYSGIDSNNNGVLDTDEQSDTPQVVCNGSIATSAFSTETLAVGSTECSAGGILLNVGLDNNSNGSLDTDEITSSIPLCNSSSDTQVITDTTALGSINGTITSYTSLSPALSSSFKSVSFKSPGLGGAAGLSLLCANFPPPAVAPAPPTAQEVTVPQSVVEPIEVPIQSDGSYTIPDLPSGEYELIYEDGNGNGEKIDNIIVQPGVDSSQNVTDVKPTGSVTLKVASLNSGANLTTASVKLNEINLDKSVNTTDAIVTFDALPEGSYSLRVSADGYVEKFISFDVVSAQTTDLLTIELNSQKGRLSGSVEVEGIEDLSNIIVYVKGADGTIYTSLTNSNGSYVFNSLAVDSGYSVIAYAHDYTSQKADGIDIKTNETSIAPAITLTRLVFIDEVSTGSISGFSRYSDMQGKMNHAGIIVSLEGTDFEAITARDGSFVLNNIPAGNYTLNMSDSNHLTLTKTITVVSGSVTSLLDEELNALTGTVNGVVQDTLGNVVYNATVIEDASGLTTTTDEFGAFSFTIPIGTNFFSVQKDGYAPAQFESLIESDVTTDISSTPIEILKQVLVGTVSKGEGATDHSGIAINVVGAGLYAVSSSDGNYTINGIPSTDIVLEYSADGFQTEVLLYNPDTQGFSVPLQTLESAKITDATVLLNSDDMYTNNTLINLNIDVANVATMKISESTEFINANVVEFVSSYDYNLSVGDGVKTVYVRLYDASGSELTSKLISDTIILDTQKPRLAYITLQAGSFYTNTQELLIKFTAEDGEISKVKLYDTNLGEYTTFIYSGDAINWLLPSSGNQSITIIIVDAAGNEGDASVRNIIFDTTVPVLNSITIAGKSVVSAFVTLVVDSAEVEYSVEVSEYDDFRISSKYTQSESIEFTLSGEDGDKTLYIRVLDNAGNASVAQSIITTLDTTKPIKPTISITNAFTNTQSYELSLSTPSSDTNLAYYQIRLNNGEWESITNSALQTIFNYSLVADSLNTLQIRAVDEAGNISDVSYAYITHDQTALISTATPSGGIYNIDTEVSLSALHADRIYYTIDGSDPDINSDIFNSNIPILFSTEGIYTLKFFSVDEHENQEVFKTQTYTIDKTAPVIEFGVIPVESNSNVDLDVNVTDELSVGIRYEVTNDGSEPPVPSSSSSFSSGTITVSLEGTNVKVKAIGIDEAGNSSNIISAELRIDKTSPILSATTDIDSPYPVQNGKVVTLDAVDSQDQAPKIYYTLDGTTPVIGEINIYSTEFNLTEVGTYNLASFAVDNLGNISDTVSKTYRLSTIYDSSNRDITTDTTWTKAASPYSITTDVIVSNGATLTIEAGVEIIMSSYSTIEINDATLIARGVVNDTIKFIGNDNSGSGGIYFNANSVDASLNVGVYQNGSIVEYVDFLQLRINALDIEDSSPYIKDVKIDGASNGIRLYKSYSKIINIDINDTSYDAIVVDNTSNVEIENATIKNYGTYNTSGNAIDVRYGAIVSIIKSDILYYETLKMFKTNYSTYSLGTINATQNYFHSISLSFLDTFMDGDNITYTPMLSGPIESADFDGDGLLDLVDSDDDNDSYLDSDEANAGTSQFDATTSSLPNDFDNDFISDATDTDDDDDGFLDVDEIAVGSDDKNSSSIFELVNYATLESDTTLPVNASISTLLIKNDLEVPQGLTLTIRAGTKIVMGGNYAIKVYGSVKLLGELNNKITITPKLPSSTWSDNHFNGFIFYNTATPLVTDANNGYVSGSIIQHTDISYGGSVVATIYRTDEIKNYAFVYLDNTQIDNSKYDAIHILNGSKFVMKDSNITNTGVDYRNESIYAENSNIVILNSAISNGRGEDIEIYDSVIDINNSVFSDNSNQETIWAENSTINSSNNSFLNSRTSLYLYSNNTLISTNDTIDSVTPNTSGAIEIRYNSKATITNLSLSNSSKYGIYSTTNKKVELLDSNISNSGNDGFYAGNYSVSIIKGSKFEGNSDNGINIYNGYYSKVEDCNITSNGVYGVKIDNIYSNGESLITQNSFSNNSNYAIWTDASPTITFNDIVNSSGGGIHLFGSIANPDIQFNNIYSNYLADTSYDILNEKVEELSLFNNYHGTVSRNDMLLHNKDLTGIIYFNNFLNVAVNISAKTSADYDNDGIMDIYDNDDDNDLILDIIETDKDNVALNPFADDTGATPNDSDTDRDGTPNSTDTDDDGDGILDVDDANPLLADADGDGLDDGVELSIGSDPLVKDVITGKISSDTEISVDTTAYNLELLEGVRLYSQNNSKLTLTSTVKVYGSTIEGLNIDANGITYPFYLYGDTLFKNTTISNATSYCINTEAAVDVTLDGVTLKDSTYGLLVDYANSSLVVKDSIFQNIEYRAVYISTDYIDVNISSSDFSGIDDYAIYNNSSYSKFFITNNMFRKNNIAIFDDENADVEDSTIGSKISNNTFESNRYVIYEADKNIEIKDNIYANNVNLYKNSVLGTKTGNYEVDDRAIFKAYIHGQTTAVATDDGVNTTIKDSELSLSVDELVGAYIQADVTSDSKYEVVSNTADTITFSGIVPTASKVSGIVYTLYDFRVRGAALTASSTGGIVGAFSTGNDPVLGYESYIRTHTPNGTIDTNELWDENFEINGTLTINAKVRMARGLNIDVNVSTAKIINLNKNYNFTMSDTDTNRTTISSNNPNYQYWGDIATGHSQDFKNLVLKDSYYYTIRALADYTKLNVKNSILRDARARAIESYGDDSYRTFTDTRFINIGGDAIFVYGVDTDVTITGCEFNDVREDAIQNETTGKFIVKNNLFRNSVYVMNDYIPNLNAIGSEISNNTFDSNQYAIYRSDENVALRDNLYTSSINVYSAEVYGSKTKDYISPNNPYTNKYIENLHVADGHVAKTYASDSGEVGMYGGVSASFAWLGSDISDTITPTIDRTTDGTFTTNEYWDSNTTIAGNITVPKGVILKIAAGSIIKVAGGKITIEGEIFSEGISGNEIIFTSNDDTNESAGQWVGIELIGIGATFENAVVKYAQTALDLYRDGSNYAKAYTISDVTIVSPSVYGIDAGEDTTVEDTTIFGGTHGIYSRYDSIFRRNLITNTSSHAIYVNDGYADINHNLLINNSGKAIEIYYYAVDNYPSITYNTISNTTAEAIYYYYVSGNANYNIIESSGTYAFNRSSTNVYSKDISVNAMFNSTTADYGNTMVVNPKAKYADLTTDPSFTSKVTINVNDIKDGGYAGIYRILALADFKPTTATHLTYSPVSSTLGAYNVIESIDSNSTTFGLPTRDYRELFYKDGESISVELYSSLPDMSATVDITNLDSNSLSATTVLDNENRYMNRFDFTVSPTNTLADGDYNITVSMQNQDISISDTITTGNFTLDNTGASITLADFTNDSNISVDTQIHFNVDDGNGAGVRKIEYSTDNGTSWSAGDSHIVVKSIGGSDAVGYIQIDTNLYTSNNVDGGFHLVELNTTNFSIISEQSFANTVAGYDDFVAYLQALNDGNMIAFAARYNSYYDSTRYANLKQALDELGFIGDFDNYDSVSFIGYKGAKKSLSITKIVKNTASTDNAVSEIDFSAEYGIYNNAFTLSSSTCFNDDGSGNCNVKARGTDLLGNVGSVFDINYTIAP